MCAFFGTLALPKEAINISTVDEYFFIFRERSHEEKVCDKFGSIIFKTPLFLPIFCHTGPV